MLYVDDNSYTKESELDITYNNLTSSGTVSFFKFKYSTDYVLFLILYEQYVNTETVTDLRIVVKNTNDEIIFTTNTIPEVILKRDTTVSSSDGYIANASIYINAYANNAITKYSSTLFSSTNDVANYNL